jgi:membrane associated rhomboid family serine protease
MKIGAPSLTPYVRGLMIACGVMWLLQVLLWGTAQLSLAGYLGLVPGLVIRGWLWQPLTYMFLHSPQDLFHILFNMLLLWMFGGELERHWGSRAFLRYYLVCGVGGGVFATVMGYLPGGSPVIPTIGASGAIFGLLTAYGLIFAERTVLFMLIFPMKARTMAIIMFVITFFYTFSQPSSGVSHIAHLGGAVVGFLYLKRVWRIGALYRELQWKRHRRKFTVMPPNDRDDFDRWVH